MQRLLAAGILSTFCFSLAACETTREAVSLRPDLDNPARLVCEPRPDPRPDRGEPYVIDWGKVETVAQAKIEHDLYLARERDRNGVVTAYVLEVEGKLFVCSNNMQWWRDYWSKLPDPAQ